jgi:hypothetical protein
MEMLVAMPAMLQVVFQFVELEGTGPIENKILYT